MSEIALYNILKKIDGTTDDEIEKAVSDVARSKDVATKADLEIGLSKVRETIAELRGEVSTIKWMGGFIIAMNVGIFIKLFF